jgi:hypothetical protein
VWHVWGRRKILTGFWWENLKGRKHLEDLGEDERIILKCILKKQDGRVCTGLIWLRIGTSWKYDN